MTIGRFLREYFVIDKRPANAFQWKGVLPFSFDTWYMLFYTGDGEGYSFEHMIVNPADCQWDATQHACTSKYLATQSYVGVTRYSMDPRKKLQVVSTLPPSEFVFEASDSAKPGHTLTFDIKTGRDKFVSSPANDKGKIDWYSYDTLKATFGVAHITSYLNNPPREDEYRGALDDGHNRVSWDLRVRKVHSYIATVGGATRGTFLNMYWSTPRIDAAVTGEVTINGEVRKISNNMGYQEKLWGSKLPDRWLWTHCNSFEGHPDADVSFTISGEDLEILGVKIPQFVNKSFEALGYLFYRGRTYPFDSLCDLTQMDFGKKITRKDPEELTAYVHAQFIKPFRGLKVVYECFDRQAAQRDEWLSSDDSVLSSDLSLVSRASLKIYRLTWKGWSLVEEMATNTAAGILVGGKKGTDFKWYAFPVQLLKLAQMVFYLVFFFTEEMFFSVFAPNARWRQN